MKERPILYSGPMVRAILEGRKTQTRRVMKPQPVLVGLNRWRYRDTAPNDGTHLVDLCPYGQPGDLLWVRETWWHHKECRPPFEHTGANGCVRYEATEAEHARERGRWLPEWYERRPSIYMPRWASRLTLRITDVRVQRLQDIWVGETMAEGWPGVEACGAGSVAWFIKTWDSLYAKRGYSWESNPWVWVLTFERVSK